jgi:N-acetyltransferase
VARDVKPVVLAGALVRLEPLEHRHIRGLMKAAAGDRETFRLTGVPLADEASLTRYVQTALTARDAGLVLPFATIRLPAGRASGDGKADEVVGSTRFTLESWTWPVSLPVPAEVERRTGPESVEIGSTWLTPAAQRSGVNLEAKLLMLSHAFETWKCFRVALRTDERNLRSRASIESLGFRLEGIVRNQMYAYDGEIRNTAQYSMLANEWPAAKTAIAARIGPSRR